MGSSAVVDRGSRAVALSGLATPNPGEATRMRDASAGVSIRQSLPGSKQVTDSGEVTPLDPALLQPEQNQSGMYAHVLNTRMCYMDWVAP